ALAAGELADALLLIGTLEVEARDPRPARRAKAPDLDVVEPVGDFLPDRLRRIERVATLVDAGRLHGVADAQLAGVGLLLAHDHPEQRRLAGAVRPDHADDAAGRQAERQLVEEQPVAEALAQALGLDDVAQRRARRDEQLVRLVAALRLRRRELLEALQARLALRLARLRIRTHPLELGLHRADARRFLLRLDLEPLLLLLEPRRVVAL